jgi:hypothetical protein
VKVTSGASENEVSQTTFSFLVGRDDADAARLVPIREVRAITSGVPSSVTIIDADQRPV